MRTHPFSRAHRLMTLVLLALGAVACTQTPLTTPPTASAAPAPAAALRTAATPAANAAGTWKWTVDAGGSPITHTAVLTQDGEKLAGTFTDSFDNTTVPIKEGKLHDGQITLTVVRPFQDNGTMTFNFAGKLEGNTIKGKIDWTIADQPGTADWNAQRGS